MRTRGFFMVYLYFMLVLGFGACVFIYFMSGNLMRPEAFLVSGAVLCCFSVMYGIFLLETQSDRRLDCLLAGHMLCEQDVVLHMGRSHGAWFHVALCEQGVVLDGRGRHFEILAYSDIRVLRAGGFVILVKAYDNAQYRFVFQKQLRMAAVRDILAARTGLDILPMEDHAAERKMKI